MQTKNNFEKFLGTYEYQQLKKQYSLNDYGIWRICGEDPNCDFGGFHHQPYLETVRGKLHDVIKYAVELPNFWRWGAGGSITKIEIKQL